MSRKAFQISVTLRSPFLFEGIGVSVHALDSSPLRGEKGELVLPGDHLRGHLRHAFSALHGEGSDIVSALFGKASEDRTGTGEQDKPVRGALIVADLKATKGHEASIYHRVAINEATGAAATGMLQLIELAAPMGAEVTFKGRLMVRPGARLPERLAAEIDLALSLIPAMGAMKSSGFGEVVSTDCRAITDDKPERAVSIPSDQRVTVTVTFDRPLLVDSSHDANNIFRSAEVVPGGAIKGALAQALADAGHPVEKNNAFSNLHVSHAFPLEGETLAARAIPSALTVVKRSNGTLAAASALDSAAYEALCDSGTPAFPSDWKDENFDLARKALGRPAANLRRFPRGRVAIAANGVAEESKLFVVETVGVQNQRWRFTLDFVRG